MKRLILSFDIEEHDRIEAAVRFKSPPELGKEYAVRMERTTRRLLDLLAETQAKATFFIVADIGLRYPSLIREIAAAGHEIGSHSLHHHRVHRFNRDSFYEDLHRSKEILEQTSGQRVQGFRAPTFSVVRQTAWAIEVLEKCGFTYDSSIFPVRHDRYGIHDAPRTPFLAQFGSTRMLELPPVTLRLFGMNLPVGGGGYFRLFPSTVLRAGIRQTLALEPAHAMLYFHPWEFDPTQPKLPLGFVSRFRTYVGIGSSLQRFKTLLNQYRFHSAAEVIPDLHRESLNEFPIGT